MSYPSMSAIAASHPSRGAWIEISTWPASPVVSAGRTPHGVRGLKYHSHRVTGGDGGRTPHGVRGLKSMRCGNANTPHSRTPHGVRGLK